MTKKIVLALVATVAVVGGVAGMSAYEAHVINVTAHIENALSVTPEEIPFGTVFPQEKLYKPLTLTMSNSFQEEGRVDGIEYKIVQKPKFKEMTTLAAGVTAGESIIEVESATGMEEGDFILIGPDSPNFEYGRIESITGNLISLDSSLSNNHSIGEMTMTIYEYLCSYLSKHADGTPENDTGVGAPHNPPQCQDEQDNDADGLIDYPDDPQCASHWDNDEAVAGDQPMVFGRLAKSENDYEDVWTIDLVVPCFQGMCAQDYTWEEFGWPLAPELEGETFGCDLWIEVTGISQKIDLENKDANWDIIPDDDIDGTLSYMPVGDSFKGVVMATGLEPNKQYQLTINGPGGDVSVGSSDDLIAGSACDAGAMYRGGWWTGSLPVVCQSGGVSNWEGFYVFDLVAHNDQTALAVTDGSGDLYYSFDVAMRSGSYSGVKFLIKENFSPWQGKMFEVEPFDFTIY